MDSSIELSRNIRKLDHCISSRKIINVQNERALLLIAISSWLGGPGSNPWSWLASSFWNSNPNRFSFKATCVVCAAAFCPVGEINACCVLLLSSSSCILVYHWPVGSHGAFQPISVPFYLFACLGMWEWFIFGSVSRQCAPLWPAPGCGIVLANAAYGLLAQFLCGLAPSQ